MNILLLGGYRFLGRAVIETAHARGHHVTAFNRGNLEPMAGVEQITGNRDDPAALDGRAWDAVVDTSGQLPRHVRRSAGLLANRVAHYTFVSSLSAYREPVAPGLDESAPLATMPPGEDPEDITSLAGYGARKASCEVEAQAAMPGRVHAVRAGFIVGPHDTSDRFTSLLDRACRGAPLIVPGDPAQPVQVIDVGDLAAWIVDMAERREAGAYNATGPAQPYRLDEVLRTCVEVAGTSSRLVPIPSAALLAAGVEPWTEIAFWTDPQDAGLMSVDVSRAIGKGLRFRPLRATVERTLAWAAASDHARRVAISAEKEARTIAAYEGRERQELVD